MKTAVIGTGFIGPVHVEALKRIDVEVAGIVGSTAAKSKAACQQLNLPFQYPSFDEVLADDSVQSVHLATPNRLHFQQARDALNAGKHVLCEKPLAMNSDESQALVQLAAEKKLAAGVAYNIRFYPLNHELAARFQQPDHGDLLHIQGSYVQDWLLKDTDFNWRVSAEDGGELRAIADIGTHWLDLVQFIAGQPVASVFSDLRTVHATRHRPQGGAETFSGKDDAPQQTEPVAISTEDCGCVLLRFANGANGCLWVSQTTAGRKNCLRFEIASSDATYAWNSEQPNALWIGRRDRPSESLVRDPASLGDLAAGISNYPGGHNEGFPDTFKQLFGCFYRYIANGDFSAPCPFPTFADGHHEILLCEAILQSHREQRWVNVVNT